LTNFLEQLVAEWLEYQGYFVRRNVKVSKRSKGGYDGELDVVGFNPETKKLVHYEPSMDCYPWPKRRLRFSKKFAAGRTHIPELFEGLELPTKIDQIALLVYCPQKSGGSELGGGRLKTITEFMKEIKEGLADRHIKNKAIPEQFTILRALQFANEYWGDCQVPNSTNSTFNADATIHFAQALAAAALVGLPPFAPLALAALRLASVFALPPFLPNCAIQRRFP
jgi:hypothetical protein